MFIIIKMTFDKLVWRPILTLLNVSLLYNKVFEINSWNLKQIFNCKISNLDTKGEEDVLDVLENIDDDLDRLNIAMVKVYEREAFKEWGVSDKTSIFYFENGIPNIYTGFKGLK